MRIIHSPSGRTVNVPPAVHLLAHHLFAIPEPIPKALRIRRQNAFLLFLLFGLVLIRGFILLPHLFASSTSARPPRSNSDFRHQTLAFGLLARYDLEPQKSLDFAELVTTVTTFPGRSHICRPRPRSPSMFDVQCSSSMFNVQRPTILHPFPATYYDPLPVTATNYDLQPLIFRL